MAPRYPHPRPGSAVPRGTGARSLAPPATGRRLPWESVPAVVRAAVERILGASVTGAVAQAGGFSPGAAVVLTLADGRRAFAKAVSAEANPQSPQMYRDEARNAAALPAHVPAPRLLGTYDDGAWVVLVFEAVEGRQPHVPWARPEFDTVLDALTGLSRGLTPAPFDAPGVEQSLGGSFRAWRAFASGDEETAGLDPWALPRLDELAALESTWAAHAAGDTLAHADLRADNILLTTAGGVAFVDWAHVTRAAPWFDLFLFTAVAHAQGLPDPDRVLAAHPLSRTVPADAVTAVLAALTGYFLRGARRPDPPGLPTVRAFQRAQADACLAWLRSRLTGSEGNRRDA